MRRHHFFGNFRAEAPFIGYFRAEASFIGYLREDDPILLGKFGRRLVVFFLFMFKTMLEVGWSLILWSMLYMEGHLDQDFLLG